MNNELKNEKNSLRCNRQWINDFETLRYKLLYKKEYEEYKGTGIFRKTKGRVKTSAGVKYGV